MTMSRKFSEGLAMVERNDRVGFVDKTGALVMPPSYDNADSFSEGLAPVEINDQRGFIDKKGNVVIAPAYDDAGRFPERAPAIGGMAFTGSSIRRELSRSPSSPIKSIVSPRASRR